MSGYVDMERIFLIGRSLGGAVGLQTLTQETTLFKGAVIENTFTNISDMSEVLFPFLKMIPALKNKMLRIDWNSLEAVKQVETPLLFITGSEDTFVPPYMT